ISLIVELIEDPEEIRGQMKSLSVMKRGEVVTAEDVNAMCLDDGSKSLLRLLDGLCNGDRIAVLKNFRSISNNGDLIPLTSALHNRMRLAWYAAVNPRESAMFAKSMGARDYAWRMAGYAAKRYGKDAVSRFVMGLIRINVDEKGGAGAGWNSLEALLIEILEKGK
ncbi:MAG: hypothetical protein Q4F74_00735, partial [Synergistaceae bacterium]|nr:hypothetical protein [Synergistaceae bacterium]